MIDALLLACEPPSGLLGTLTIRPSLVSGRDIAGAVELSVLARTVGSVTMVGSHGLAVLISDSGRFRTPLEHTLPARHEFSRVEMAR